MGNIKPTPRPWKMDGTDLWHIGESYDSTTDPHTYTGVEIDKNLKDSPVAAANLELCCACVNTLADIPNPSQAKLAALLAACDHLLSLDTRSEKEWDTAWTSLSDKLADFRAERSGS